MTTLLTWVCWSITSETRIRYGLCVFLQGRGRAEDLYQARRRLRIVPRRERDLPLIGIKLVDDRPVSLEDVKFSQLGRVNPPDALENIVLRITAEVGYV